MKEILIEKYWKMRKLQKYIQKIFINQNVIETITLKNDKSKTYVWYCEKYRKIINGLE